jgi:large subunit ribosomal protein L29
MEKIESKNLNSMTLEQLNTELETTEALYQETLYNHNVSALSNATEMKITRKNVARIKTEIRSRELALLEQNGELQRDKIRARRKKQKKNSKK